jgi:GH25 family lysozyme M1 (1,4-beta-N-acetylmuramidase)
MRAALILTATVAALVALPHSTASAVPTQLVGPDVSSYQHPSGQQINWDTVFSSGGQSFAIVKATEDADFTSPTFAGDWQKLEAKGAIRGTYHYAQPSTVAGDAVAEARWYVSKAGPMNKPGHLPPILDLEEHNGLTTTQMQAWTKSWLDEVQKLTGRKPMIYTSAGFWNSRVASSAFGSYPLQVAHFTTGATPNLPTGWSTWTLWQYTESATVAGIPAKTDHNRF